MEEFEKIDPLSLSYVTLSELHYLPRCAGIYFVIEEDGKVIYIGQSLNIYKRWHSHHIQRDLCDLSDLKAARRIRLAWLEIADVTTLDELERQLIQRFLPRLNDTYTRTRQTMPVALPVVPYKKRGDMLTTREAAERLGVAQTSIRVWLNIDPSRFPNARQEETPRGPVWLIPESDLEGFEVRGRGRPAKSPQTQTDDQPSITE